MRDTNDNNIDDNIEQFAILGGLAHLAGQRQLHQQSAEQLEELRRLRESAERSERKAARAKAAEEARIRSLPQCPLCGGRLDGQFRKCIHCASDLAWVGGLPCEPGKENELKASLIAKRKTEQEHQESCEREIADLQSEVERLTVGLPDVCPQCGSRCPGIYEFDGSLRYGVLNSDGKPHSYILTDLQSWIESINGFGQCPRCSTLTYKMIQEQKGANRAVQQALVAFVGTLFVGGMLWLWFVNSPRL